MKKIVLWISLFSSMNTVYPGDPANPFNPDIDEMWDKKFHEHQKLFAPQPETEGNFVEVDVFAEASHFNALSLSGLYQTPRFDCYGFYLRFGCTIGGWFPFEKTYAERFKRFTGAARSNLDYDAGIPINRYNESSDKPSHPNDDSHTKTLFTILAKIREDLIRSQVIPKKVPIYEKRPQGLPNIKIGILYIPKELEPFLKKQLTKNPSKEELAIRHFIEQCFIEQYFNTALNNPDLACDPLRSIPPLYNLGAENPPLTRKEAASILAELQNKGFIKAYDPHIIATIDCCANRPDWADNPGIMFDQRSRMPYSDWVKITFTEWQAREDIKKIQINERTDIQLPLLQDAETIARKAIEKCLYRQQQKIARQEAHARSIHPILNAESQARADIETNQINEQSFLLQKAEISARIAIENCLYRQQQKIADQEAHARSIHPILNAESQARADIETNRINEQSLLLQNAETSARECLYRQQQEIVRQQAVFRTRIENWKKYGFLPNYGVAIGFQHYNHINAISTSVEKHAIK